MKKRCAPDTEIGRSPHFFHQQPAIQSSDWPQQIQCKLLEKSHWLPSCWHNYVRCGNCLAPFIHLVYLEFIIRCDVCLTIWIAYFCSFNSYHAMYCIEPIKIRNDIFIIIGDWLISGSSRSMIRRLNALFHLSTWQVIISYFSFHFFYQWLYFSTMIVWRNLW